MSDGAARLGDRVEQALEHRVDVEGEIARGEARRPSRRRIVRSVAWLTATAASLYLVAPALLDTFAEWEDLVTIAPAWLAAMAALQAGATLALWALQRLAMHTRGWHAVATSQLAGNGIAKVAPGGGAIGAAVQYRMLVQAGIDRPRAVAGLTASNVLTLAIVLALPVFAIPALVTGSVDRGLMRGAVAGLAVFAVLLAVGAWVLARDEPLQWVGRTVQRVRNRLRRSAEPARGLPQRLVAERDRLLATVGPRWKAALATGAARWMLDYGSLLAALAAVAADPRPGLVLLAFCTAQLLAQIPVTPGGLGFVEAGLAATLGLAGVSAGDALLATLAYRLFTYWLPLPLALAGTVLHRRRYVRGPVVAA